ncbi:MAG: branched-chain amino acid ABC transporter permease, partial [Acidimicrobiia bacterium]|nr:branched-chain amino acid ABC transporter permease [Acidimicrobiia bacterium]
MTTATVGKKRASRLNFTNLFRWVVGSVAVVVIFYGSIKSVASGRLSWAQWRDLMVFGVAQGSVYALIAMGYTMVYGVLRFINFAHGEVFMSGAMIGYFVADALNRAGIWNEQPVVSLLIVLLVSMTTATSIAVILERVAYRPLRGAPRLIPLITSIGASFTLQYLFRGLFGAGTKAYPPMAAIQGKWIIFGIPIL